MPARPALQPVAVLTVLSGDVLMRLADGDFITAVDGTVLYVGTTLRTGANARALITLFEGSTVELDPASDITIEELTARQGSAMAQAFGRGLRVIMHLTTADSRFAPTTPASTASVRGIDFEIHVAAGVGTTTTAVPSVLLVAPAESITTRASTTVMSTTRSTSKSDVRKFRAEPLVPRAPSTGRSRGGDDRDAKDLD